MNKINFHKFLYVVILCSVFLETKGQQIAKNTPAYTFDTWRTSSLQEKLFVHTDKDSYLPGEIAWFKIYYVDGTLHKPLQLSQVAYMELIDQSNKPVVQAKISLKKSDGSGSIVIPQDVTPGFYKLRCYTQWMKNFDANFYFEKLLTIVNEEKGSHQSISTVKDNYDLAFFPEGGNLVNGMKSKVAFTVMNEYENGIDCEGVIIDGQKDTLFHIQASHMGIGHFDFTPVSGHEYIAHIVLANGKVIEKQLPSVLESGITMRISQTVDEKIGVSIQTNDMSITQVYVFAHTRGAIKMADFVSLVDGHGSILLDKNKLDEGITDFTVFKNNQPVCERLYFIFPHKQFQINASVDAADYGIRKKIRLSIRSAGMQGSAFSSKMSVSVFRVDSIQNQNEDIQSYLLLTSDIMGYIESPSWYFENEPGRDVAMDDLMLTRKWSRFKWNDILDQQKPNWKFAPEFNGEIISTRVTGTTGSPLEDAEVYLSVPGVKTKFRSTLTNPDGIANFEINNSFGMQQFIFESPDSNAVVNFISPFSDKFSGYHLPPYNTTKDSAPMNSNSIYLQVQHVYNENKLNSFIPYNEDSTPFFLKPDVTYVLSRYTKFSTLEEVLREYIREINVIFHNGSFRLQVYDALYGRAFDSNPLILLDGVAILDINKFMKYDPLKIKSIGVVTKKYFLGNIGHYGIVDCKTYKGDMNGYVLDPRSAIVDFDGLQQQREFYMPSYETQQKYSSRLPDFRTLLYWNPSLKTGETGSEDIEFYTSDAAGKYVVVIQGISAQGIPASTSLYFNVKK